MGVHKRLTAQPTFTVQPTHPVSVNKPATSRRAPGWLRLAGHRGSGCRLKENPMSTTPQAIDLQNPRPSSLRPAREAPPRAVRFPNSPLRRRFHRTSGFWLGGTLLAVGGCLLGLGMPYSHPVAVTFSVLWWGIYLGCFGASVGAVLGLWVEQAATPPSKPSWLNHSNHDA
jgi:hypothetical protein